METSKFVIIGIQDQEQVEILFQGWTSSWQEAIQTLEDGILIGLTSDDFDLSLLDNKVVLLSLDEYFIFVGDDERDVMTEFEKEIE